MPRPRVVQATRPSTPRCQDESHAIPSSAETVGCAKVYCESHVELERSRTFLLAAAKVKARLLLRLTAVRRQLTCRHNTVTGVPSASICTQIRDASTLHACRACALPPKLRRSPDTALSRAQQVCTCMHSRSCSRPQVLPSQHFVEHSKVVILGSPCKGKVPIPRSVPLDATECWPAWCYQRMSYPPSTARSAGCLTTDTGLAQYPYIVLYMNVTV